MTCQCGGITHATMTGQKQSESVSMTLSNGSWITSRTQTRADVFELMRRSCWTWSLFIVDVFQSTNNIPCGIWKLRKYIQSGYVTFMYQKKNSYHYDVYIQYTCICVYIYIYMAIRRRQVFCICEMYFFCLIYFFSVYLNCHKSVPFCPVLFGCLCKMVHWNN